jgi:hypothetical protein
MTVKPLGLQLGLRLLRLGRRASRWRERVSDERRGGRAREWTKSVDVALSGLVPSKARISLYARFSTAKA